MSADPAAGAPADAEAGARMLARAALDEALIAVRAYDTKAQIVGVGYIFALGVVERIADALEPGFAISVGFVVAAWATLVLPAVMFGYVLYPTRKTVQGPSGRGLLYLRAGAFAEPAAYVAAAREADPLREIAAELFSVSQLREIKRRRFLRALFAAGAALMLLLAAHILQALL
ncbi:hypothetical protein LNKW23_20780 [Paralimibaculum aggregatum]|uniref:Pycsar effector protein domain-containing protein n=1 Tax=Paralimibaculum aggregatum TaxID=3036245 RepID=A0ABQ6LKT5_9RHOB|nr:hypothetical protein [Limibaculum sp. NKW23]GMG82865.1 hypothetical protein LNKW23_20780 [Limibaculum sp. NKW23]